jgi:hypothetical protein
VAVIQLDSRSFSVLANHAEPACAYLEGSPNRVDLFAGGYQLALRSNLCVVTPGPYFGMSIGELSPYVSLGLQSLVQDATPARFFKQLLNRVLPFYPTDLGTLFSHNGLGYRWGMTRITGKMTLSSNYFLRMRNPSHVGAAIELDAFIRSYKRLQAVIINDTLMIEEIDDGYSD